MQSKFNYSASTAIKMNHTYLLSLLLLLVSAKSDLRSYHSTSSESGWLRHTIDDSSTGADGVKLTDWNEDGLPDIVTGWEEGGLTRVYLHPGVEQVNKSWPHMTVGETPAVEDAVFVDLDGEAPLEILSCTEGRERRLYIHWAKSKEEETIWQQQSIPKADSLMQWMFAIPFDLSATRTTIVAAGKGQDAAIGWFDIPADAQSVHEWIWYPIGEIGWIMSILPADLDGDGDLDLLLSDRRGEWRGCRWLENAGPTHWKSNWKNHWIGAQGKEVMFIDWVDLDQDGTKEVLTVDWTDKHLSLFKPSTSRQQGTLWTTSTYPLPREMRHPKSVTAGDLNGDGIQDIVISSNTRGKMLDGLVWLDGKDLSPSCESYYQSISGAHNAKYDKVELIDMDLDGDLDILICEENYGPNSEGLGVIWYENQLKR